MSATAVGSPAEVDDRWSEVSRLESLAGEIRVNLIRAAAVLLFYGQHLFNIYVIREDISAAGWFHVVTTAVTVAWALLACGLYVLLARNWDPPWLKFAVTTLDLVLLSILVAQAGVAQTSLVALYFVIIAAAPPRLSSSLVAFATLGAIGCYLVVVGYYAWYQIGRETYYTTPDLQIPRIKQLIQVLALGTAGVLAGQFVRQARRLVETAPSSVED